MRVLCLGDSLTKGMLGYSYVDFINKDYECVNKGKNGDTITCAYKRLERYLKSSKYDDIDTYIICIGANDILLPYMSDISLSWDITTSPRVLYKDCQLDEDLFKEAYERYLVLLKLYNKKIITIGIPKLELKDFPLDKVIKRNKIIKSLVNKYKVPFIDIYKIEEENYTSNNYYSWEKKRFSSLIDDVGMTIDDNVKDKLGTKRKLIYTVDGAHYNMKMALLLAQEVRKELEKL